MEQRKTILQRLYAPLRAIGPGIFAIGYTIGTGSVTAMVVAGSTYGMQLLWVLFLSCLFSWVLMEAYGRYYLVTGETALYGFRKHLKFGRFIALLIIVGVTIGQWNSLIGILGISANVIFETLSLFIPAIKSYEYLFVLITAILIIGGLYTLLWIGKYSLFEKVLVLFVTLMGFCLYYFLQRRIGHCRKILNKFDMIQIQSRSLLRSAIILWLALIPTLFIACNDPASLVHNLEEFNQAVKKAKAGDQVVLANGIWKDVELKFTGEGTEAAPITLTVETKGKVTIEGLSNLRIGGKYLVVEGLVFKNGYTPTSEVISFRKDKETLSYHCRVTECVIDNFNNPERIESDYWVGIYGKNNRFDHNYLTGKRNHGVTLAVRLDSEESRENHHRIDHNYFGHRPVLGDNGGETLRIGTSHHSMSNSNTLVEYNYFDRCNGEHEIISNKSCQNTFRFNTFNECQGTLTMRHGNETLVESNYFFGNGKANTGGIRIINEKQKVINNYGEGLTGYRFRGALVIMNGVPNSPINRYFQVKDSEASNNTFINCDYIQLCAGSDEERSAIPENTLVSNNIFYNETKDDLFTVYDDISGITFKNNVLSENLKPIAATGFRTEKLNFKRNEFGILVPIGDSAKGMGMTPAEAPVGPENTGVNWYPRVAETVSFGTGSIIPVKAGINTLFDAAKMAQSGDIIELTEAGEYELSKTLELTHSLVIRAAKGLTEKPLILFQKPTLFAIENGGSLQLQGVIVDGSEAPDVAGNAVIRTSRYSMTRNYKLFIEDCDFRDLDVNHTFNVFKVFKNTFADSIVLRNSTFHQVSGSVLSLAEETDDLGIYNAENVIIDHCLFTQVQGSALNLYRGGSDESTFGPMLCVNASTFAQVGQGKRNKTEASLALHGVQLANISHCVFNESEPIRLHLSVGEPVTKISNCNFYKTPEIISNDEAYETSQLSRKDPKLVENEGYDSGK